MLELKFACNLANYQRYMISASDGISQLHTSYKINMYNVTIEGREGQRFHILKFLRKKKGKVKCTYEIRYSLLDAWDPELVSLNCASKILEGGLGWATKKHPFTCDGPNSHARKFDFDVLIYGVSCFKHFITMSSSCWYCLQWLIWTIF